MDKTWKHETFSFTKLITVFCAALPLPVAIELDVAIRNGRERGAFESKSERRTRAAGAI